MLIGLHLICCLCFWDWSKSLKKNLQLPSSLVCWTIVYLNPPAMYVLLLNGLLTKVAESSHSGTDAFLAFCSTLSACMLLPYQATTTWMCVYQMEPPQGYLSRLEILALSLPELISQLDCSLWSNDSICEFFYGFRDSISMISIITLIWLLCCPSVTPAGMFLSLKFFLHQQNE